MAYDASEMTSEPNVQDGGAVELWQIGTGDRRRAPIAAGPVLETVIGARSGRPFGVLDVSVPPGGSMPEHDHGASEALLIPREGVLRLVDNGHVTELVPGTLATIPIGCRVRLENPGDEVARLFVVLTPPDFVAQLGNWPAAE